MRKAFFLMIMIVGILAMPLYSQTFTSQGVNGETAIVNGHQYHVSPMGVEVETAVHSPCAATDLITGRIYNWSSTLWTNIKDVRVVGTIAYCVLPNGLMIIDVANQNQPELIDTLSFDREGMSLCIYDGIAYIARIGDVLMVDVSNPYQPYIIGSILSGVADTIFANTVVGTMVYAACGTAGVQSYDLALQQPSGSYPVGNAVALSIDSTTRIIAVADFNTGCVVLDASDSCQLVFMGRQLISGHTMDLVMADSLAYCVGSHGLSIVSLVSPSQPVLIGDVPMPSWPVDVCLKDSAHVITAGYNGVTEFDVTNPALPQAVINFRSPTFAHKVLVHNAIIYLCDDWAGLRLYSFDAALIGAYATPGHSDDLCMWRNYLLVADMGYGMRVIDRNDFRPISLCDIGWGAWDVVTDTYSNDNYAFIVGGHNGLVIVDMSDPYRPAVISQLPTSGNVYGAHVVGGYAYLANLWGGWVIADVTDRSQPSIIATRPAASFITSVFAQGNTLYVLDQNTGLYVWDISDPTSPQQIGYHACSGRALTIIVRGNYAYIACAESGVEIVDIAIPSMPTLVAIVPTWYAVDIHLSGHYLFVADNEYVTIIDVIDPIHPVIVVHQPVINISTGITAKGLEAVYGASDVNTWAALFDPSAIDEHDQLPAIISLAQNYPNPFNPVTTIGYTLPLDGQVRLDVYDVLGRLIDTPINGYQTAGDYRFMWDGTRFASGVYLYRLTSGQATLVSRMTLIK